MKITTIRMPEKLIEQTKQYASDRGISMSSLIRMLVSAEISERKIDILKLERALADDTCSPAVKVLGKLKDFEVKSE